VAGIEQPIIVPKGTRPETFTGLTEDAYTFTIKTVDTAGNKSGGTAHTVEFSNFTTISTVQNFLSGAPGGATADDPILLPVKLALADGTNGWTTLLSKIRSVNKFVALDLSACTPSNVVFDPGTGTTGVGKIVSLVLPSAATSIKAGTNGNSTFKNFTALTSVSGSGIKTIGNYAFREVAALATAYFPAAESIDSNVFAYCTGLATADFPAATSISAYAFAGCTALTTANFPAATSIDHHAFAYPGATALTVTLGSTAPKLEYGMFYDVSSAKTVTVLVPSGATGYGTSPSNTSAVCWGNGFRGAGWTITNGKGAFSTNANGGANNINSNITLTIQAIVIEE
jgi:hypothetical protein